MLTSNGALGGASWLITLPSALEIPTVSELGLGLLALLLAFTAARILHVNRSSAQALLVAALLVTVARGVAQAAIVLDGDPADWNPASRLGVDPFDDAAGADVLASFAAVEGNQLSLRVEPTSCWVRSERQP